MKFAKSYVGLLVAVCACMYACTSENGGVAGTVTDTGNTIALGGVVTRTDGSRAVAAMVRVAREPSVPIVDKIGEEYNGKALVAKVNVDEEPEIAGQFGVRSIPTFLFFKDGQLAEKHVGTLSESAFKSKIDTLL